MSRKRKQYTTISAHPGWYRLELLGEDSRVIKTPVIAWVIANDFYEGDRGGSPPDATPVTATSLDLDDVIYLLSPEGEVTSDERYWNTLDKWVVYERERLEVAQRAREADARERRREKIAKDKGKEAQEAARAAGRSEYEALVARYDAYEAAGGAQRRPSDEGLRKQAEPAARDQPAKAEQVTG